MGFKDAKDLGVGAIGAGNGKQGLAHGSFPAPSNAFGNLYARIADRIRKRCAPLVGAVAGSPAASIRVVATICPKNAGNSVSVATQGSIEAGNHDFTDAVFRFSENRVLVQKGLMVAGIDGGFLDIVKIGLGESNLHGISSFGGVQLAVKMVSRFHFRPPS